MARKSGISFFAEKHGYFTTYRGDRHRLATCDVDDRPDGPNYLGALKEFARIMQEGRQQNVTDDSARACVLRWERSLEAGPLSTLTYTRSLLKSFKVKLGHVSASQLRPWHVFDWIDTHQTWSSTTKLQAFHKLKTCFRWNLRASWITANPLERVSAPKNYRQAYRGQEYLIDPELVALMLDISEGAWRDMLFVLWMTGARPGELMHAIARNYRPADRMIFHSGDETTGYRHKNANRKQSGDRHRRIYLDTEANAIIARNAARGGWLLPAPSGVEWQAANFHRYWRNMMRHPKIAAWMESHGKQRRHVIPYGFRHTFITNAILRGVQIKTVADLCGTSVLMIEKHYSHATADTGGMYKAYLACLK